MSLLVTPNPGSSEAIAGGWDGHDWNVVSWPCQTVKALDGE